MSSLADFLFWLTTQRRAVLRHPPEAAAGPEALSLLRRAFSDHALGVAGTPIAFDAESALAAGQVVHQACWLLANRIGQTAEVERALAPPPPPRTPGAHLSADVVFRFLPAVLRRARAHQGMVEPLLKSVQHLLRLWPLSGVLADIADPPLLEPNFDHPGLALLYAERLAEHDRPGWRPSLSETWDLVQQERGMR